MGQGISPYLRAWARRRSSQIRDCGPQGLPPDCQPLTPVSSIPSVCEHMFVSSLADMPSKPSSSPLLPRPELVFGLVYGAGADADPVARILGEQLEHYAYELRTIRLSNAFPGLTGHGDFRAETPTATSELQDMGDELRERLDTNDALAQLAVYLIDSERKKRPGRNKRIAWLIRSLRRPEEVRFLRRVYGARFILLAAHVPEETRLATAQRKQRRWSATTDHSYEEEALHDLRRDERDPHTPYGQAMRDTFSLADFFVDFRNTNRLRASLPRIVRLIFGETFETPTRDEQAMYLAHTASLRSAEMGRQVGAALVSSMGDTLAVGTNDVPAPGGGLYWEPTHPDELDGRDFAGEPAIDSNTDWQQRISRELLTAMGPDWLSAKKLAPIQSNSEVPSGSGFDISDRALKEFLKHVAETRFRRLTEFGRSVHSEMDALTTAARHGISTLNCTMVVTTFPCHNCMRHMVAAGICRVVYMHPYLKSLALELHNDSLAIEPEPGTDTHGKVAIEQYVGVAPRGYAQYFEFDEQLRPRKNPIGEAQKIKNKKKVLPLVMVDYGPWGFGGPVVSDAQIAAIERAAATAFRQLAGKKQLSL
jgi:deoxycytidylate deaminase